MNSAMVDNFLNHHARCHMCDADSDCPRGAQLRASAQGVLKRRLLRAYARNLCLSKHLQSKQCEKIEEMEILYEQCGGQRANLREMLGQRYQEVSS